MKFVLLALLGVIVAGCASHRYRVEPLDVNDDAAVARCGRERGRAGWLQHIDEVGDYIEPPASIYCVTEKN